MGYQPVVSRHTNYFVFPSEEWLMCPGCSRPISVYAHSCAHCGRVVPRYKHQPPLKWDNPNEYEVMPTRKTVGEVVEDSYYRERLVKSLLFSKEPLLGIDSKFEIVARMMDAGMVYSNYYMASIEQLAKEVGLIYRRGGINKEPFPDEP